MATPCCNLYGNSRFGHGKTLNPKPSPTPCCNFYGNSRFGHGKILGARKPSLPFTRCRPLYKANRPSQRDFRPEATAGKLSLTESEALTDSLLPVTPRGGLTEANLSLCSTGQSTGSRPTRLLLLSTKRPGVSGRRGGGSRMLPRWRSPNYPVDSWSKLLWNSLCLMRLRCAEALARPIRAFDF